MAKKKKNERVILEDIELKPQVIGYTFQKKSNIGRVIFIFIIFLLVVYYINDLSVFINKLIGKESANTIENLANSNNNNNNENNEEKNEIIYNIFDSNLIINEENISLNSFNYSNNILTFNVLNSSNNKIDLSDKKYFLELYSEEKTLLERFKLDIKILNENSQKSFEFNIKENFYYIVLEEKTIEDYPIVNLVSDEVGLAKLTCVKDIDNIVYTFKNNVLESINHTISDNDTTNKNYYKKYNSYQSKITTYNNLPGISATFNGNLSGYTAIISIDLQQTDLSTISENYYFGYKEIPKVVKFEMQTYGFICN